MKLVYKIAAFMILASSAFAGVQVQQGDAVHFSSVTVTGAGIKMPDGTTFISTKAFTNGGIVFSSFSAVSPVQYNGHGAYSLGPVSLSTGVSGTLPVASGGTGTASPGLVAGTNVSITGSWPNQTVNSSGGGGGSGLTYSSFTATNPVLYNGTGRFSLAPVSLSTAVTGTLPVANGGTGTGSPGLVAGTNITSVTGVWPSQTINATTQTTAPGGANTQIQFNNSGSFGGSANMTYIAGNHSVRVSSGSYYTELSQRDDNRSNITTSDQFVNVFASSDGVHSPLLLLGMGAGYALTYYAPGGFPASFGLRDGANVHSIGFKAPATLAADHLYQLPTTPVSGVQLLQNDGSDNLSWATVSGGGGSSALGVNYNGVSITSPTAQINFLGAGVTVTATGSTATVTIPATIGTINSAGATLLVTNSTGPTVSLDVNPASVVTPGSNNDMNGVNTVNGVFTTFIPNNASTATVANRIVIYDALGAATVATTNTVSGIAGIALSGAGNTGSVRSIISGTASCDFDGSTIAGDIVTVSTFTAGKCHSGGANPPIGQILGVIPTTNNGVGTYSMMVRLGGGGGFGEYANGSYVATSTITWQNGATQTVTLTANTAFAFVAPQRQGTLTLVIRTGAGGFTATWPANVKWSGGTAPTITVTASKTDFVVCKYLADANYYCSASGTQNF